MILLLTPEFLQSIKKTIENHDLVQDGRFKRVLKLTVEEAKDLVREAMRTRGWSDFALLLEDSVADAIRRDIIRMRFESNRFRDRDTNGDKEFLSIDDFWAALRNHVKVGDEEAEIAILAVLHDHLAALLGDKSELRLTVPKIAWKN